MQSLGIKRLLAVAVSALAAVALLALAAWLLLGNSGGSRAPAVQIIAPPPPAGATAAPATHPAASPAGKAAAPAGPAEIAVYVTGEVVNPGVYSLTPGQRLDAAIALAGGPTDQADLNRVNLAAYVTDAAHYRVPATAAGTGPAPAGPGAGAVANDAPLAPGSAAAAPAVPCASPVDINAATAHCLETLPGIGRVRAEAIVAHREQAGPFATADGIVAVPGIGDGIYRRIANLITVTPP